MERTWRMLTARIALWAGVAAACGGACGGSDVDARLAGESTHFRLFFGKHFVATASVDELLAGLETNWSDTKRLLSMPDGRIDYYLLGDAELPRACTPEFAACETGLSIYTPDPVDQHELNHAYMALRSSHVPPPLLVEGIAEAIGCNQGGLPPQSFAGLPDWRTVLASSSASEAVYRTGRQLVRYLLLTFDAEQVLAYYAAAPATADADAFAAHFRSFWSRDLDEVWATMQAAQPSWGPDLVLPVCPCSVPPVSASAQPSSAASTPGHPYWTWPELMDDTLVWSGFTGSVELADCTREQLDVAAFKTMFARLSGPFYANVSSATVVRGAYVADACVDASPYDLSLVSGDASIGVAVSRAPDAPVSVYLRFAATSPALVVPTTGRGSLTVCPSCDFTQPACQALSASGGASAATTGDFIVRWDAPAGPEPVLNMLFSVSPT